MTLECLRSEEPRQYAHVPASSPRPSCSAGGAPGPAGAPDLRLPARGPSVVQVGDELGGRAHQARWYVVVVSPRRPSF